MPGGQHGGDMIFYRFHEKEGPRVVITNDITGANLPKVGSGWKADGQTVVKEGGARRLGVDAGEIIETIDREGFFMGSVHDA
jgi:hypothetical protein